MMARPLSTRPAAAHRHLVSASEGVYVLDADDIGCLVHVDQVRRDRNGEMRCTLTLRTSIASAHTLEDGTLQVFDNFNLSSVRDRQQAADHLQKRARVNTSAVDFLALLDDLSLKVRRAEQVGGGVTLSEVEKPSPDDCYVVDGLPLPKHQPTTWAGYGDTGKSFFALHVAGRLCQQGISTLFVDYEMDAGEHRARLEALFGDDMPRVRYLRATRPLLFEQERIARELHEFAIDYLLIDSIGPASQGKLTDEESALGYFRALRGLRRGALSLAHLPKPREGATDDQSSIFGSVFFFNLSRSVWHLRQATDAAADHAITVGFFHKKNNLGRKHSPLGFELRFESDRALVKRVDLAEVDSLAKRLPLHHRIKHLLKRGPRTVDDLAAELEAKPDTMKRTIRRFSGDDNTLAMFVRLPSADGTDRIGLRERRIA